MDAVFERRISDAEQCVRTVNTSATSPSVLLEIRPGVCSHGSWFHSGAALDRELGTLRDQTERARKAERRYHFALDAYKQLMRHRIANPIAVITGVAQTLRDCDGLSQAQHSQLLDALLKQTLVLQSVALSPRATSPIESVLEPWPIAGVDVRGYE